MIEKPLICPHGFWNHLLGCVTLSMFMIPVEQTCQKISCILGNIPHVFVLRQAFSATVSSAVHRPSWALH